MSRKGKISVENALIILRQKLVSRGVGWVVQTNLYHMVRHKHKNQLKRTRAKINLASDLLVHCESEYQPFEYWKHFNTKLFEVRISIGLVFKWSVYVLCSLY